MSRRDWRGAQGRGFQWAIADLADGQSGCNGPLKKCPGQDLNLQGPKAHQPLKLARLPIPPPGQAAELSLCFEADSVKLGAMLLRCA